MNWKAHTSGRAPTATPIDVASANVAARTAPISPAVASGAATSIPGTKPRPPASTATWSSDRARRAPRPRPRSWPRAGTRRPRRPARRSARPSASEPSAGRAANSVVARLPRALDQIDSSPTTRRQTPECRGQCHPPAASRARLSAHGAPKPTTASPAQDQAVPHRLGAYQEHDGSQAHRRPGRTRTPRCAWSRPPRAVRPRPAPRRVDAPRPPPGRGAPPPPACRRRPGRAPRSRARTRPSARRARRPRTPASPRRPPDGQRASREGSGREGSGHRREHREEQREPVATEVEQGPPEQQHRERGDVHPAAVHGRERRRSGARRPASIGGPRSSAQ